jgi:HPP family
MVAMHLTGTFHPPAGIDPLVVVVDNMSWDFLVVPVGIGVMLLALFAFAWHSLLARGANRGNTWPARWWWALSIVRHLRIYLLAPAVLSNRVSFKIFAAEGGLRTERNFILRFTVTCRHGLLIGVMSADTRPWRDRAAPVKPLARLLRTESKWAQHVAQRHVQWAEMLDIGF